MKRRGFCREDVFSSASQKAATLSSEKKGKKFDWSEKKSLKKKITADIDFHCITFRIINI